MNADKHVIRSGGIAATIKADGAELCSLKTADGLELLWQAGPEWPRHAPLLFPIVGQLRNDELTHRGKVYPMMKHGVARDHRFEWVKQGPDTCALVLNDNAETRARYPFPFQLAVACKVGESELEVSLEITNTGKEMMPASIGGHPAFNWPLLPGLAKEAYALTFSDEEPAPIRRLADGLMRAKPEPNPIHAKNAKTLRRPVR
jgi:galactose mutarotase-like enzyme